MPRSSRALLLILVLFAAGLRFPTLFSNHFHADEALFASWARLIAIWREPLLLGQAVDKPPLLFYLAALPYPLFGPVEWAARLPNFAASILAVPLTAVLAWRTYRQPSTTLVAAFIVACAPMPVQFSATVFTDPLLTTCLLVSLLWIAPAPRPAWAGFIFGLAVLTKHQAWLFLPLAMGLAWLQDWRASQWRRALAGFLPPLLLLLIWQLLRSGRLDLWDVQLSNFGGLRLAWSFELLPRLQAWFGLWRQAVGSVMLPVLFLIGAPFLWWRGRRARGGPVDRMLILFVAAYMALHWLVAVPVWDRYLLPLVPLVSLIIGRSVALLLDQPLGNRQTQRPAIILAALLLALLLPAGLAARDARYALGGRPDADQGAWQVAAYLDHAPYGTVLYDHWYSWHWRYAFIDKGVYTNWFLHPQGLAEDLSVFGREPGDRFLVLPADNRARPVLRSVADAGFSALPVLHAGASPGMILYQLQPAGDS